MRDQTHSGYQRVELLCGMCAAVLGVLGVLLYLFAPIYQVTIFPGGETTYTGLLIDANGHLIPPPPDLTAIALLTIGLFIVLGVGVVYHRFRLVDGWKYLIAADTVALVITLLLVNWEFFRLFLIPGVFLALLTSFLALAAAPAIQH